MKLSRHFASISARPAVEPPQALPDSILRQIEVIEGFVQQLEAPGGDVAFEAAEQYLKALQILKQRAGKEGISQDRLLEVSLQDNCDVGPYRLLYCQHPALNAVRKLVAV